jgi:hypothetical protein
MSTVFQAFFVSYLVEPAYEKKIETFDELLGSDIIYGYHPIVDIVLETGDFIELRKFSEKKSLKEECIDVRKCVQRTITKNDMASLIYPVFASYVASELGIADGSRVICYLDENIVTGGLTILFKRGNVFLDRFNVLIRRCLEAGFLEKHWFELQHLAHVRSRDKLTEGSSVSFVTFSISHLSSAFAVLILGYILSSLVFISELILKWINTRMNAKDRHIWKVSWIVNMWH